MIQLKANQNLMSAQASHDPQVEEKALKIQGNYESEKSGDTSYFHQLLSQAILQRIDIAAIAIDTSGKIVLLNSAAEKLTGWKLQDSQTLLLSHIFKVVNKPKPLLPEDSVGEIPRSSQPLCLSDDALLMTADQRLLEIIYSASPIYDKNQMIGTTLIFKDVSLLHKTDYQQQWQPEYDSLTGLISRSSFENYLERILQNAKALEQRHILCYLNLDRFKIINQSCGYLAGDEFLRQFSTTLQKRIRKADILARLGGDEFGLILQHCRLDQALNVLQALQDEARKFRFFWQDYVFNFTFSAGITLLHPESESGSNLLIEADSACSIAKGKGRDRVHVYQVDDEDVAAQHGDRRSVLRVIKALEENQFLLYYQPIVSTFNRYAPSSQCFYEVLIRLQNAQGELISPADFLPAAERYGLMHLVDRWVIQNLFRSLNPKNIRPEQSSYKDFTKHCYSINLSGSSFNDDQFLEFVQEQFSLHLVSPQLICFEITETVAISNLDKAAKFISQMRKLGCRFALDDFGSGMSSFGYLRNLPIDYIKIDGSFIKDITKNTLSYEIVKAINSIAHSMNIETTAEFVENDEILALLKAIRVDYVQGYAIAKPVPLSVV